MSSTVSGFHLHVCTDHLGVLLKQILTLGLGWGPRPCISYQFPSDVMLLVQGPYFEHKTRASKVAQPSRGLQVFSPGDSAILCHGLSLSGRVVT